MGPDDLKAALEHAWDLENTPSVIAAESAVVIHKLLEHQKALAEELEDYRRFAWAATKGAMVSRKDVPEDGKVGPMAYLVLNGSKGTGFQLQWSEAFDTTAPANVEPLVHGWINFGWIPFSEWRSRMTDEVRAGVDAAMKASGL